MINIEKRPVPKELQKLILKTKNYRSLEVVEEIRKNFNNKCYICEIKESTSINIEHFIPHKGNEQLKFKWENLYLACNHCNGIKGAKYDKILDPVNEDVESVVKCKLESTVPWTKVIIKALKEDETIINTANLLNEIFNKESDNAGVRTIESINLKKRLLDEMIQFEKYLYEYYYEEDFLEDREIAKKEIIRNLKEKSEFTAFKRWVVKENKRIYADFKEYF